MLLAPYGQLGLGHVTIFQCDIMKKLREPWKKTIEQDFHMHFASLLDATIPISY